MDSTWLERARALRPVIEAGALDAETRRQVDADVIAEVNAAGLLALNIPSAYGGEQVPAPESLSVLEELAYADSAVGWCAMIYSTTAVLGSFLPAPWGEVVYRPLTQADGSRCSPLSAGAAAPSGRGRLVDGGIEVSGRWAWGSGTQHCDWICGGTLVEDNGELLRFDNGEPMVHVMFFTRDQVQLQDNWNPSGLRGTGSVDFVVEAQVVPTGRWTVLGQSRRQVDAPLYRYPFFGYFAAAVATVPLGIARRAVDDFEQLSRTKKLLPSATPMADWSIVQLEFAEAEAQTLAAQQLLFGTAARVWDKVAQGQKADLQDRRQLRLAAAAATRLSAQAVDRLYHAAGGTALQGDCSLQKHFRDIHAATQHRMVGTEVLRMAGAARISDQPVSYQL